MLQGIAKLPWVKSFVILGLSALVGKVSMNQLRSIHRVLEDRELRTHINLVDVLDDMGM